MEQMEEIMNKVHVTLSDKYEEGPFRSSLKVEDIDGDFFDKIKNNFIDKNGNYRKNMLLDFYEFIAITDEIENKRKSDVSSEWEVVWKKYLFLDGKCNHLYYRQFLAEEPIRKNSKILEALLGEPILNVLPTAEKIEKIVCTQGNRKFIKENKDKIDSIIKEMKAVENKKEANEKEYVNDLKIKEELKKLLDLKTSESDYQNEKCNCLRQFCSYIEAYIKGYIRNGEVLINGVRKVNPKYLSEFIFYIDNYIEYELGDSKFQQRNDDSLVKFQNYVKTYQKILNLQSENIDVEEKQVTEFKPLTKVLGSQLKIIK